MVYSALPLLSIPTFTPRVQKLVPKPQNPTSPKWYHPSQNITFLLLTQYFCSFIHFSHIKYPLGSHFHFNSIFFHTFLHFLFPLSMPICYTKRYQSMPTPLFPTPRGEGGGEAHLSKYTPLPVHLHGFPWLVVPQITPSLMHGNPLGGGGGGQGGETAVGKRQTKNWLYPTMPGGRVQPQHMRNMPHHNDGLTARTQLKYQSPYGYRRYRTSPSPVG
jgi:hypothetical protein